MAKWSKKEFKLRESHRWKAKPGYKIFVADRGAVRFDYPGDWVVLPGDDSIRLYDRQPPDDNCLLQISVIYLPLEIDWSDLPLTHLLGEALKGDDREILARGPIHHVRRPDLELAWTEYRFLDTNEQREALSRACLARGSSIQPFITLDFWPEDAERLQPIWDEVLRSLRLGEYVKDPTRGPGR